MRQDDVQCESTEHGLAWLRAILETAVDAIITIDADGVIQSFNAAAERIFGFAKAEAIGQPVAILMGEPYAREHQSYISRYLSTGENRAIGKCREVIGQRKDGSQFPIELNVSEVRSPAGRYYSAFLRDISRRRKAEEQARERQAELARVTRLISVGEMAAGIAHELNQPLTAILNYAESCLLRLPSGSAGADELRDRLELITVQAERAGDIIRTMRSLLTKRDPQRAVVDLNKCITGMIKLIEPDAVRQGIPIRTRLADDLPSIRGDAIPLQQVVLNLIQNGIEAMAGLTAEHLELSVTTERAENGLVRCSVSDDGSGIESEALDRMFEPFFTTKADGLGMGLSISRSIIEAHGGHIGVCESNGRGATFAFVLPVAAEDDHG